MSREHSEKNDLRARAVKPNSSHYFVNAVRGCPTQTKFLLTDCLAAVVALSLLLIVLSLDSKFSAWLLGLFGFGISTEVMTTIVLGVVALYAVLVFGRFASAISVDASGLRDVAF